MATEFLQLIPGYLEILRAHGVDCVEVRSDDPGRVVYEDEHQVVVVPSSGSGFEISARFGGSEAGAAPLIL
ncbi:hypothetical protein GCM10017691_37440 [Pseudonocardia petroleophila]